MFLNNKNLCRSFVQSLLQMKKYVIYTGNLKNFWNFEPFSQPLGKTTEKLGKTS